MIVVTGAAGFIGCNIVKGLNALGRTDILTVDDLTNGKKFRNLAATKFSDYQDHEDFLQQIIEDRPFAEKIEVIFHAGACSTTTEWNGRYMMRNNYDYSKCLLNYCAKHNIQFIYASSAAVYGANSAFKESSQNQLPLNVYGYSKWVFDQYMLRLLPRMQSQVVGLRYFNVYGPHEQHKGCMASVAFHFMNQLRDSGVVKLFESCDGYGNGEQLRDFISVDDVVKMNLWFFNHPDKSGIFNVGTGKARSFNDLAKTLIELNGYGEIQYIPFPDNLKGAYQSFTEADISALRAIGYTDEFYSLEEGLQRYFQWMSPVEHKVVNVL